MSADDWLAAMDDAFTVRLTHCTLCGRRASEVYFDIWVNKGLQQALGTAVCLTCHARRDWRHAVDVVMQYRYGLQERKEPDEHA